MRLNMMEFSLPALLLLTLSTAHAQTSQPPTEGGTRVRVTLAREGSFAVPRPGVAVSVLRDSLLFLADGDSVTRFITRGEIGQVERSVGEGRETRRGFIIGAAAGAGIGTLYAYRDHLDHYECYTTIELSGGTGRKRCDHVAATPWGTSAREDAPRAALVVGVLGAMIGYFNTSEHWERWSFAALTPVISSKRIGFTIPY